MNINLSLRPWTAILTCICVFFAVSAGAQAPNPRAMPVTKVEKERLPVLSKAPVVVELFSSQACVFCPKADRLFADLVQNDNIIGLACHIDYFDVKEGSLAQEFCTARQTWYMEKLAAGPNYTPQMVINGALEVIGYKFDEVLKTLQKSTFSEIQPLEIAETGERGTYQVALPLNRLENPEDYKLWLALYDRPHDLVIADGRNRGQKSTYYNIVSQLGSTGNIAPVVYVTPPMNPGHAGFVVILQDMQTGRIFAVGRHKADEKV